MTKTNFAHAKKSLGFILATALFASAPQVAMATPLSSGATISTVAKSVVKSVNVSVVDGTKSDVKINLKSGQAGKTAKLYVSASRNGTYVYAGSKRLNKFGNTVIRTSKSVNVGSYLRILVNGSSVYNAKVARVTKASGITPTFQSEVITSDGFTVEIPNYALLSSQGLTPNVVTTEGEVSVDSDGLVTVSGLDFAGAATVTASSGSSRFTSKSATYKFDPETVSVANETQLRDALADQSVLKIRMTNNISLANPLSLSRSVSIEGASSAYELRNDTVTVTAGTVQLKNLTMPESTNNWQENDGNYGVMVMGGSLIASNLHLYVDSGEDENNDGFSVASGASLTVRNSELTIVKSGTSGSYAVYAQSGAENITLTNNILNMVESGAGVDDGFTYLVGTQGDGIQGNVSVSGNSGSAEVAMMVYGKSYDTSLSYASWIPEGAIVRALGDGYSTFFKKMDGGWGRVATTTAEFDSALADDSANAVTIFLQPELRDGSSDIQLSAPLELAGPRTIDGVGNDNLFLIGDTITVVSGDVTLKNLYVETSVTNRQPEGNYGILVNGGSLSFENSTMWVDENIVDTNNVGFSVANGASLTVLNSDININKRVQAGSYAVYAQSGAENITLTDSNFWIADYFGIGYTHLIGTEGIGIQGAVNVSGGDTNAEVTMMVAGNSVATSLRYASWAPNYSIVRVLSTGEFFQKIDGVWQKQIQN